VKRTVSLKLNVSGTDLQALCELQELFSNACNHVAAIALEQKESNRIRLHHLSYYQLKANFPQLGSQMSCNAIAKTAQALKALKKPKEILFRKRISVHFDKRTYSLKNGILSLFTLGGRVQLPLKISPFPRGRSSTQRQSHGSRFWRE